MNVPEAPLRDDGSGLTPGGPGWFVVNVRDAAWKTRDGLGSRCVFESDEFWFRELGIRITVIQHGEPSTMYHRESNQEDFLVLSGECLLLIEEEERPLRTWDFVHLPPMTTHGFVGAGDGPCVILMIGSRNEPEEIVYPVSEVAARHGAAVEKETPSPEEAYAPFPASRPERPQLDGLPWA